MEKFKTVNQVKNVLKEDGYKFKYKNNDSTDTYWDYDGKIAIVDLKAKTIEYKGMI